MFRSLRVRLALSHAFVMLVILTILGGLVLLLLARNLDRGATDQLAAEAGAQVERIQEGGAFAPTIDVDLDARGEPAHRQARELAGLHEVPRPGFPHDAHERGSLGEVLLVRARLREVIARND